MQPHCTTLSKTCTKCGKTKPATEFSHNKSTCDGLKSQCKACDRAYREANLERLRAYDRARTPARKEWKTGYDLTYRSLHVDRERERARLRAYRATHLETLKQRARERAIADPEGYRARNARYRFRKHTGDGGTLTAGDILKQLLLQSGRCHYCGECLDVHYHIEHVTPLTRGGANIPGNLVIACPSCNSSKHNKLPDEWTR